MSLSLQWSRVYLQSHSQINRSFVVTDKGLYKTRRRFVLYWGNLAKEQRQAILAFHSETVNVFGEDF